MRFPGGIKVSALFTFDDHIRKASPINCNNEVRLTVAATQNRRINSVTLKSDCISVVASMSNVRDRV